MSGWCLRRQGPRRHPSAPSAWSGREGASTPWPLVLGRTADVVVTPGNPGIAGVTARGPHHHQRRHPGRGHRGRPVRDRARGPAGRRPGRPAAGRRPAGVRPRGRRRPAGGLQGLHEGDAGRGRRAHRPLRRLRRSGRGQGLPAHPARAVGDQDRRPGRRQGRAGHRARWPRPRPTSTPSSRATPSATPAGGWWSRRDWSGRSAPCSSCATATAWPPWPRPRTSSGWATATRVPTPGAWARTRRCPSSTTSWSTGWWTRRWPRWWRRCVRRGIDYRGVLYAGLMLTPDGPEGARVQRALRRPRDPGGAAPAATATWPACWPRWRPGALRTVPRFTDDAAVCVVWPPRAIRSRPGPATASPASTPPSRIEGVTVFHAGTAPAGPGASDRQGGAARP